MKLRSLALSEPKKPSKAEIGFPSLSWEDEELETRPMPLHERPLKARVDVELALVAERHPRVAHAIETFWGHKDCVDYIQSLVLNGYKEGEHRLGFKPEVVSALMTLVELHKEAYGA
jgi:hypothetical protein